MDERAGDRYALAVGGAIAAARVRAGLTQDQVAEALEIGTEAVSRIERGVVDPSVSRLYSLAVILGCGVGDLVVPPSDLESDQARVMARVLADLLPGDRGHVLDLARLEAGYLRERSTDSKAAR